MMPILRGSMSERRGVRPHQPDRLLRVGDRVGGDVVAVLAQAIAQDHRVDAVVVEERHEVGALGADVEGVVAAAGDEDHRRAGVDAAIDGVELDARVVDVDDAADAARHRLAQVVGLGLAHAIGLEQRRARRIQRHDDAARHDRLRRIRRGGGRARRGDAERRGQRRQRRLGLAVNRSDGGERQRGRGREASKWSDHVARYARTPAAVSEEAAAPHAAARLSADGEQRAVRSQEDPAAGDRR